MAPEDTGKVTASVHRAQEVVKVYQVLRAEDKEPDNAKHLWALAVSIVSDVNREPLSGGLRSS